MAIAIPRAAGSSALCDRSRLIIFQTKCASHGLALFCALFQIAHYVAETPLEVGRDRWARRERRYGAPNTVAACLHPGTFVPAPACEANGRVLPIEKAKCTSPGLTPGTNSVWAWAGEPLYARLLRREKR